MISKQRPGFLYPSFHLQTKAALLDRQATLVGDLKMVPTHITSFPCIKQSNAGDSGNLLNVSLHSSVHLHCQYIDRYLAPHSLCSFPLLLATDL